MTSPKEVECYLETFYPHVVKHYLHGIITYQQMISMGREIMTNSTRRV